MDFSNRGECFRVNGCLGIGSVIACESANVDATQLCATLMSVGMVFIERLKGTTDVGPFGVSKQSLVNVLGGPPSRLVSKPWATGGRLLRFYPVPANSERSQHLLSTRMTKREEGEGMVRERWKRSESAWNFTGKCDQGGVHTTNNANRSHLPAPDVGDLRNRNRNKGRSQKLRVRTEECACRGDPGPSLHYCKHLGFVSLP
jgi:hypothetical protein